MRLRRAKKGVALLSVFVMMLSMLSGVGAARVEAAEIGVPQIEEDEIAAWDTMDGAASASGEIAEVPNASGDATMNASGDATPNASGDAAKTTEKQESQSDNSTIEEQETYTITFYSEEGYISGYEEIKHTSMQIRKGERIDVLYYPKNRPGYICTGWKTEGDDNTLYVADRDNNKGIYIGDYIPNGDTIFIAQWEEAYNVIFYSNEGYDDLNHHYTDSTNYPVIKGGKVNNWPYIDLYGCVLAGWKIEGDDTLYVTSRYNTAGTFIGDYVPNEDVTFIAQWEKAYNITFHTEEGYLNDDDGSGNVKDYTIQNKKGDTLSNYYSWLGNRPGYVITGWKIEGDDALYTCGDSNIENSVNITQYVPIKDTTFIAQWEVGYKVTFYSKEGFLGGGTEISKIRTEQVAEGRGVPEIYFSAKRSGYKLVGWKTEGDNTLYVSNRYDESGTYIGNYIVTKDTTFVAQWEEAWDVTFVCSTEDYTRQIEKGKKIDTWVWPGEKSGYVCTGWKTEGDNTLYAMNEYDEKGVYIGDYVPTKDTTFVAQWEEAWDVTFYSEFGHIGVDTADSKEAIIHVKKGNLFDSYPSIYGRKGYVIKGWKIEGDDILYTFGQSDIENSANIWDYEITKDITFVAEWVEAYNITFHTDEGSLYDIINYEDTTNTECQVEKGKNIFVCPEYPYRIGFILKGWKIEGDKEDILYTYGDSNIENSKDIFEYVPKEDVTFIAVWEKVSESETDSGEDKEDENSEQDANEQPEEGKTDSETKENTPTESWSETDGNVPDDSGKTEGDISDKNGTEINDNSAEQKPSDTQQANSNQTVQDKEHTDDQDSTEKAQNTGSTEGTGNTGSIEGTQGTGNAESVEGAENIGSTENTGNVESTEGNANEYAIGEIVVTDDAAYEVAGSDTVIYQEDSGNSETSVVIPDTVILNGRTYRVTEIAENAFKANTHVKKVTIGSGVVAIGKNAFAGCSNLTTVTIKGNNLAKVEAGAFQNCKKLTKVTLGKKVTTIGKNAFSGDKKLKTIIIKSKNLKSIGKNAFKNISKKAVIKVPKSLSKKQLTKYKKMFKKAGVPGTVKIKQ